MSSGLNVQCSVLESRILGSALTESPVKALQGNQLYPYLEQRYFEVTVWMPIWGITGAYQSSIATSDPQTYLVNGVRKFYNLDTNVAFVDGTGSHSFTMYSYHQYYTETFSTPPIGALHPVGTDKQWSYVGGVLTVDPNDYFAYWTESQFASYFGNAYNPLYWTFTETTLNYDNGAGKTGSYSLTHEFDYSSVISYAKSRIDTLTPADYTTAWGATTSHDISWGYPNRMAQSAPYFPGMESSPTDYYSSADGAESITYPPAPAAAQVIYSRLYSKCTFESFSAGGAGAFRHVLGKSQVRYNGSTPLQYFLAEIPNLAGAASISSIGKTPFRVIATGTMNYNDIVDIPYPSWGGPPQVQAIAGCGNVAMVGMNVYFCAGPVGGVSISGVSPPDLVEVSTW